MTSVQSKEQCKANKAIIKAFYAACQTGDPTPFLRDHLDPDFFAVAPNYVPLGDKVHTAQTFTDEVVPQLDRILDFKRFKYESLIADGDQVCALVRIGIANSSDTVLNSEHWTVRNGKALSLLVIFFEPQALLDSVNIPHGLTRAGRF